MLPHESRFLLGGQAALPPPGLLPLAGTAAPRLAPGPAARALGPPQPPHGRQDFVQHVAQQVENAQLVLGVGPNLGQQLRVEAGAIADHHLRSQPPAGQVAQEAAHVVLVVGPDQGKAHGQVGQRVGGQQQGVGAQVQLIDAQSSREALQDQPAVGGQIETGQLPAQAVVDETIGDCHEEVALQGGLGLLDVEAVAQQAVEHGLADGGVIVGLGRHVQRPGAEILAAATAGAVLCVGDLQPGDAPVGEGAEPAAQDALAVAAAAAGGARGAFGGATNPGDAFGLGHGLCPRGVSWRAKVALGRRPYLSTLQEVTLSHPANRGGHQREVSETLVH